MIRAYHLIIIAFFAACFSYPAAASGILGQKNISYEEAREKLEPHKALYDIELVTTRSGSPIINISGKMFYEWRPTCEGWITDHRFNLYYEYADSPAMQVTSDFSTFESFDGENFNFTARRKRNNQLYQEFRGSADLADQQSGKANFTIPEELNFDLEGGTYFPMTHTVKMIQKALNKDKFFNAVVFDGSDDEGPVVINTFIGKKVDGLDGVEMNEAIDKDLLKKPAWNVQMAVFPQLEEEEETADYEMGLVFHENGVISDMLVDYDDFAVTQKLLALEKIEKETCQ